MENIKNEVREEIKELQLGMKIRRLRQERRLTLQGWQRKPASQSRYCPRSKTAR